MELKLLKDKEYEQQASLNEVDKYFTDGVPVNENILGIKSQYELQKKNYKQLIQVRPKYPLLLTVIEIAR